jgi:4-hydroxybenzoate polyprenyltransferase
MALCAPALVLQTYWIQHHSNNSYILPVFVFFATLLSYNLHFSLAARSSNTCVQLRWFQENKRFTKILNGCAFFMICWTGLQLKGIYNWIVIPLLLNAAYTIPLLLKRNIKMPTLFSCSKSHFIGFTWAFVTVCLPLANINAFDFREDGLLFLNRMMLVTMATLIFDYRDKDFDRQNGLITPANYLSEKSFDTLFLIHNILYGLSSIGLAYRYNQPHLLNQLICAGLLQILYQRSKRETGAFYYLGLVDGILLFSAILSGILLF